MAYSCNPVFIETALRIGGRTLVDFCENLGFGATTGISLPHEHPGQLPGTHYMSPQDTANLAIGQGEALVTPIQIGVLLSVIANGGRLVSPKLVLEIKPKGGGTITAFKSDAPRRVLSQDTCRQLTFMLESVTRWGRQSQVGSMSSGPVAKPEPPKQDGWTLTDVPYVMLGLQDLLHSGIRAS